MNKIELYDDVIEEAEKEEIKYGPRKHLKLVETRLRKSVGFMDTLRHGTVFFTVKKKENLR